MTCSTRFALVLFSQYSSNIWILTVTIQTLFEITLKIIPACNICELNALCEDTSKRHDMINACS